MRQRYVPTREHGNDEFSGLFGDYEIGNCLFNTFFCCLKCQALVSGIEFPAHGTGVDACLFILTGGGVPVPVAFHLGIGVILGAEHGTGSNFLVIDSLVGFAVKGHIPGNISL